MIDDKIYVKFIDKDLRLKVVEERVTGINYVEQLVHRILDKEGVGPVYRYLFALRLIDEAIWLSPNANLKTIHEWSLAGDGPRLELRMRFQPASYIKLAYLDRTALDIIFAQIRADFLRTRFNDEKRTLLLLDEPVFCMIVLDLIRHSIECNIDIDDILDKVNPKDFIPRRAASWQRALMFYIDKKINLRKALRLGYERCDKSTQTLKRKYIELFLTSVANRYGAEAYIAYQITNVQVETQQSIQIRRPDKVMLRVHFLIQGDITNCIVESTEFKDDSDRIARLLQGKKNIASEEWTQVCDIRTINHATLRHNIVHLSKDDSHPVRYQFRSRWHAESFLSALDGYYRLMMKWNLNLFRDIWSPSLLQLKRLESHGPIGLESARRKLTEFERPGDFLVRQCIHVNNRFLIDTGLSGVKVILTIHVDWCPDDRFYRYTGYTVTRDNLELKIETPQKGYLKLKTLIRDIEISMSYKSQGPFRKQLKHWIQPDDNDHHPALMLCLSEKRLQQFEQDYKCRSNDTLGQLPRVIPDNFLVKTGKCLSNPGNDLTVELASTMDDQNVIVKDFSRGVGIGETKSSERLSFHCCPKGETHKHPFSDLCRTDWAFLKSHLFANTIGYIIESWSLVQEYFPIGQLDKYLLANPETNRTIRLSISFQLIQALLFLQQKRLIHGKIRCHNVMISHLHPFQVKLTDPLGPLDIERDQAFIPPEYFNSAIGICVKRFYTGIDIWALGTTMWQIFNDGNKPSVGSYANKLTQPKGCSDDVWALIETCWAVDPDQRATPQTLFRDLCDLFAWEKGAHEYFYISPEDSTAEKHDHDSFTSNSNNFETRITSSDGSEHSASRKPISGTNNKSYTKHEAQIETQAMILTGHDDISISSSGSGVTTTSRSDARMITGQSTPAPRLTTWRNLINLGKSGFQRPFQNDDVQIQSSFDELFGSQSSLDSCITPSDSEITKMTTLDLANISDAFDRCVWHINSNRLKLGPEIGRGSSGVVMKGVMCDVDGCDRVVAVKCIDRNSSSFDINHVDDLRREFDILKNLDHENIVKALGYVEETQMMLIFEFMPLGSLLSCVKNLNNLEDLYKLPLQKYALDIAKGMEYLENEKIVHRDLALRNILLSGRNEVKICDFGLAKSLGVEDFYKLETQRALPLKWYAPESISMQVFTHKSDVWSFGVVLWEIHSAGDSPQYSGTYANLSETLRHERLPCPNKCPQYMYDLMLKCWAYEPDDRLNFKQLREILEGLAS